MIDERRFIVTGGRHRHRKHDYYQLEVAITDYLYDDLDYDTARQAHIIIIQGGCPDGVDAMARCLARDKGYALETYPADFKQHPQDAVETSNQTMADHGANLCLAFPNALADGPSPGTWDMVRRALGAGIETRIYPEACHE